MKYLLFKNRLEIEYISLDGSDKWESVEKINTRKVGGENGSQSMLK